MDRYWRRRDYQLLAETGKDRRCIRLGGNRRRVWKINAMRKIKLAFKIVLQTKLVAKLRDAYLNMMLRLVGNINFLNGEGFSGKKRIAKGRGVIKISETDDFESKLILELYKEIKAAHELASN